MKVTIKSTPELMKMAKEAEQIQNACNICGLANRFAEVMIELGRDMSTCRTSQHPITRAWIDKFSSLAYLQQDHDKMHEVYTAIRNLAEGRDVVIDIVNY